MASRRENRSKPAEKAKLDHASRRAGAAGDPSISAPGGERAVPNDRKRHLFAILALLAITLLAYSNSFGTGFPLDNRGLILNDARVHDATASNVALIFEHSYWWPTGEAGLYRPFTTLSYLFNYAVLGDQDRAFGYHVANLLLHAANVLLFYTILVKLIRRFWPSVFSAALWAVHPASTESVTNIIGRSDLIAGLATFAGLLCYMRSRETQGGRRIAWLGGLGAFTAVGVFSKESAITLFGVIVLYELKRDGIAGRQWKVLLAGCAAMTIPIAAMLMERSEVLAHSLAAEFPFTDNPISGAGFLSGRLTALSVMARYLWLTVWPFHLSADYSYPQIPLATGSFADWSRWLAIALLVAGVVLLYRVQRTAFFLAMFAAVTFAPMSNFFIPIGTIMADRFLYLPSAGLLACVVLAVFAISERAAGANPVGAEKFAGVLLALIVVIFAVRTWLRNPDWQDDATLAAVSVETSPRSYKTHRLEAQVLYQQDPNHANIDRVIEESDRALELLDPLPDALNTPAPYRSAGNYYLVKAEQLQATPSREPASSPDALKLYRRAVEILKRGIAVDQASRAAYRQELESRSANSGQPKAGDSEMYRLLSIAYLGLGDAARASDAAAQAGSADPLDPGSYLQKAQTLIAQNNAQAAAITLMTGLLITSAPELREGLARLYQSARDAGIDTLDPEHCALVQGPSGPAVNPRCETIRKLLCAASVDTLKARLATGNRDLAEKQKQDFLRNYGCPAEPLNRLMPDQAIR